MSLYKQYKPEFPLVAMMIWMKNGCIQMDKAGTKEIMKKTAGNLHKILRLRPQYAI